jgi:hypothetical protein
MPADGLAIKGGCVAEPKVPDGPVLRDIRAGLTEAESADRPEGE